MNALDLALYIENKKTLDEISSKTLEANSSLLKTYTDITLRNKTYTGTSPSSLDRSTIINNLNNNTIYYNKNGIEITEEDIDSLEKQGSTVKSFIEVEQENYISGSDVWTDGTNTYYSFISCDADAYKFVNGTWEVSTDPWSYGNDDFGLDGGYVWTDGTDTYYSIDECQYQLINNEWVVKNWGENYPRDGHNVWTDGINTYYSNSESKWNSELKKFETKECQYQLINNEWVEKNWGENRPGYGQDVWTDGTDMYYSYTETKWNSTTYKDDIVRIINLKLVNGIWTAIDWGENYPKYGLNVWTDGTDTYYSYGSKQFQLINNEWVEKNWGENYPEYGQDIWTDGTDMYYNSTGTMLKLVPPMETYIVYKKRNFVSGEMEYTNIFGETINKAYTIRNNVPNIADFEYQSATSNSSGDILQIVVKEYPKNPVNVDLLMFKELSRIPQGFFEKINTAAMFKVAYYLDNSLSYYTGNNNLVSIKKQLRNYSIDGNEIASAEYIDYTFKKEKQWINSLFNPSTIQAGVSVKKYIDKQSAWTYTAAITGSYMFQLSKHNHGNTAGVYVNNRLICSYPFWGISDTGTDLAQTDISWTPQVFVKKGDVIRIESDNETTDGAARWYINSYNCSGIE